MKSNIKPRIVTLSGLIVLAVIAFSIAACDNGNNKEEGQDLIFSEEFNGTSLDRTKWDYCPNQDRQGRSTWMDDMVSVSGGYLHLKLKRDATLGAARSSDPAIANNWIRAGGIRTRSKDYSRILFQNTYGYYEASIKFPRIKGTWGAFWLMSPTIYQNLNNGGEEGTEIDIVETIDNPTNGYNAALHWNGYGEHHKSVGSGNKYQSVPVNIYDGNFHTFALHWTSSEYIFYIDDYEFWRVDGGASFQNSGINHNPNYIKLTVESAPWAGDIPANFNEAEMVVDYVRVYKQPPK
ncbi:MAG: glycoside hydrolase family 16 protein [Treponema sp.]|jgi:beta-glucanase (GH16 family)|nr:glycoside hydrolase family 16 protein [Treponema sp.]